MPKLALTIEWWVQGLAVSLSGGYSSTSADRIRQMVRSTNAGDRGRRELLALFEDHCHFVVDSEAFSPPYQTLFAGPFRIDAGLAVWPDHTAIRKLWGGGFSVDVAVRVLLPFPHDRAARTFIDQLVHDWAPVWHAMHLSADGWWRGDEPSSMERFGLRVPSDARAGVKEPIELRRTFSRFAWGADEIQIEAGRAD